MQAQYDALEQREEDLKRQIRSKLDSQVSTCILLTLVYTFALLGFGYIFEVPIGGKCMYMLAVAHQVVVALAAYGQSLAETSRVNQLILDDSRVITRAAQRNAAQGAPAAEDRVPADE